MNLKLKEVRTMCPHRWYIRYVYLFNLGVTFPQSLPEPEIERGKDNGALKTSTKGYWMCLILVDGTLVSRNNLLATVSTLGQSYRVYLKLYINSFDGDNLKSGKWAELLRLTRTNKNCCSIGDRIPLILTNKGGFIQVATQIGSSGNNWKNVNLNARTWYRLEIVQYEHNDKVLIISL